MKNTDDSVESFTHINSESYTRYRYIPIRIISGDVIKGIYAFLDEGSFTTLMSQELADELNLLGENSPLQIGWADDSVMRVEEHSMKITLRIAIKIDEGTYCIQTGTMAQHAYYKGKSAETALHSLTSHNERFLQYRGYTMVAFLDIEGAFNNINITWEVD